MATLVSFTVQDNDSDSATIPVYVQDGLTLAQYTEFAQAMAAFIDDVTSGIISAINLRLSIALPGGLASSPSSESEVQKGANLNFSTDNERFTHTWRIPALLQVHFSGDEVVVVGGGVMDDLITALRDGIAVTGGITVLPENGHAENMVAFLSGTKSHTKG